MTINIFIENMVDIVCSRCSHKFPRPRNLWHHNGVFNKYIKSDIKIDEIFFSNYFNDIEHGFFHAFCCCYISYILTNHDNKQIGFNIKDRIETKKTDAIKRHNYKEDKHPLNIRLIASLLLHDFLKCNGFSQEEHDKELKKYYSKLLPETYTHSSPSLEDDNKLLIKCDRMELRRYSDYKEWVDKRHTDLYDELNEEQKSLIEEFYENIRPTLKYFYKNRNEIFLRHGLEQAHKANYKGCFPPEKSFITFSRGKSFPIEIDRITNLNTINISNFIKRPSENGCIPTRLDRRKMRYLKSVYPGEKYNCSNHEWHADWGGVKGFITYRDFIDKGGEIIDSEIRDHLYANSEINIKNWKFIYNNTRDKNNSQIKSLRENNIGIISQELLYNFMGLVKILQDRMVVLRKTI